MGTGVEPTTIAEVDAQLDAAFVAAESDSPPVETPEAPASPSEPARDAKGRFAETPLETPEAPVAGAPESPEPPAPSEAPAEEVYESFAYEADGQPFEVKGSQVGDDGVFFPTDSLPELKHLLAQGRALTGSFREIRSRDAQAVQAAESRAQAAEAAKDHILGHFQQLVQQSQGQDPMQGPLAQWLLGVHQNWPILQANAKAEGLRLQFENDRKALDTYRQQEQQARMEPMIRQGLQQYISGYAQQYALSPQLAQELQAIITDPELKSVVLVKAPYDDLANGIRQGDLAVNRRVIEAHAQRLANLSKQFGTPQVAAAPVAKPAPKPVQAPPPTVGGKGARVPKEGKGIPVFKTQRELDAWFEAGGYNDIDTGEE